LCHTPARCVPRSTCPTSFVHHLPTTSTYTLSLHDALPISFIYKYIPMYGIQIAFRDYRASRGIWGSEWVGLEWFERFFTAPTCADRKSTRLNSSHVSISYAVFCLKKKTT